MTTIQDICTRYAERVTDPDKRARNSRGKNVFTDGDRIYSYGMHFVMAETFRNPDGSPRFVLVNGDRYSVSTSSHQSDVRSALRKHTPDVPTIIIPFRALTAAGINLDSIVPLDVKPERYEYTRHESDELPASAERREQVSVYYGPQDANRYDSGFRRLRDAFESEHVGEDPENAAWQAYLDAAPTVWAVPSEGEWQAVEQVGGRYVWHTRRHWLGDALFAARRHGRAKRVRFLSSFDRQESTPLYFLCELPPCRAATIGEALEALKPDAVILAEGVGRTVTRQGDIFAVPMPGLTARDLREQGATFGKRSAAMEGIRVAGRNDRLTDTLFNTGDLDEYRPDPARPWMKKRRSWEYLRDVREHRIEKWAPLLRLRAQRAAERSAPVIARVSLLGTSHIGTETATLPDGTQYARGIMYHEPRLVGENRERDHRRQKMGDGKTWHLIVKNTVPVQ